MNEFFGRLVQRALAPAPAPDLVQPRLPSRFEIFDNGAGESAPSDALSSTQRMQRAEQANPFGVLESAPSPRADRNTFGTATSAVQGAGLSSERSTISQWPVELQAQPHTATPVSSDTPPAEQQLVTPPAQQIAPQVQIATIQPALTLAPMFQETVRNSAQDANGRGHGASEGVGVAPPAVERPVIHVTIGRVEVRAISAPSPARPASPPRQPAQSLEDYLHGRKGGAR